MEGSVYAPFKHEFSGDTLLSFNESISKNITRKVGRKWEQVEEVNPAIPLKPYLHRTALSSGVLEAVELRDGWRYRVCFSSKHTDIDTVLSECANFSPSEIKRHIKKKEINIRLTKPGKFRETWINNCLALGNSAGRIPEASSVEHYLVYTSLFRLFNLFPDSRFKSEDIDEYNTQVDREMQQIAHYLALPGLLSARRDTAYWLDNSNNKRPKELAEKIESYKKAGRIYKENNELFDESAWLSVFNGHKIKPERWHQIASGMSEPERNKKLAGIRKVIANALKEMPSHAEYLSNVIH